MASQSSMGVFYQPTPVEEAYGIYLLQQLLPPSESMTEDLKNSFRLSGRFAVPFLSKSHLDRQYLRTIWSAADPEQLGSLRSLSQWHAILRCIALAQAGGISSPFTEAVLIQQVQATQSMMLNLPVFDGTAIPTQDVLQTIYQHHYNLAPQQPPPPPPPPEPVPATPSEPEPQTSSLGLATPTPVSIEDAFGGLVDVQDAPLPSLAASSTAAPSASAPGAMPATAAVEDSNDFGAPSSELSQASTFQQPSHLMGTGQVENGSMLFGSGPPTSGSLMSGVDGSGNEGLARQTSIPSTVLAVTDDSDPFGQLGGAVSDAPLSSMFASGSSNTPGSANNYDHTNNVAPSLSDPTTLTSMAPPSTTATTATSAAEMDMFGGFNTGPTAATQQQPNVDDPFSGVSSSSIASPSLNAEPTLGQGTEQADGAFGDFTMTTAPAPSSLNGTSAPAPYEGFAAAGNPMTPPSTFGDFATGSFGSEPPAAQFASHDAFGGFSTSSTPAPNATDGTGVDDGLSGWDALNAIAEVQDAPLPPLAPPPVPQETQPEMPAHEPATVDEAAFDHSAPTSTAANGTADGEPTESSGDFGDFEAAGPPPSIGSPQGPPPAAAPPPLATVAETVQPPLTGWDAFDALGPSGEASSPSLLFPSAPADPKTYGDTESASPMPSSIEENGFGPSLVAPPAAAPPPPGVDDSSDLFQEDSGAQSDVATTDAGEGGEMTIHAEEDGVKKEAETLPDPAVVSVTDAPSYETHDDFGAFSSTPGQVVEDREQDGAARSEEIVSTTMDEPGASLYLQAQTSVATGWDAFDGLGDTPQAPLRSLESFASSGPRSVDGEIHHAPDIDKPAIEEDVANELVLDENKESFPSRPADDAIGPSFDSTTQGEMGEHSPGDAYAMSGRVDSAYYSASGVSDDFQDSIDHMTNGSAVGSFGQAGTSGIALTTPLSTDVDDDDPFAAFAPPPTQAPLRPLSSFGPADADAVSQPTAADINDFGDFAGVSGDQVAETGHERPEGAQHVDLFVDNAGSYEPTSFEAFPKAETGGVATERGGDEDFGDFAGPDVEKKAETTNDTNGARDLVFDGHTPVPNAPLAQSESAVAIDDDDFGDFAGVDADGMGNNDFDAFGYQGTSASIDRSLPTQEAPAAVDFVGFGDADGTGNKDFDAFGYQGASTSIDRSLPTQEAPGAVDEFGDFSNAVQPDSTAATEHMNGSPDNEKGQSKDFAGEDTFNAFSGGDAQTNVGVSGETNDYFSTFDFQKESVVTPSQEDEPDEFGDFSNTQKDTNLEENTMQTTPAQSNDFGDFGEFGSFQSDPADKWSAAPRSLEQPQESSQETVPKETDGSEGDEFGDFASFNAFNSQESKDQQEIHPTSQKEATDDAWDAFSPAERQPDPEPEPVEDSPERKHLLQLRKHLVNQSLQLPEAILRQADPSLGGVGLDFKDCFDANIGMDVPVSPERKRRIERSVRVMTLLLSSSDYSKLASTYWAEAVGIARDELALGMTVLQEAMELTSREKEQVQEPLETYVHGLGEIVRVCRYIVATLGDLLFLDSSSLLTIDTLASTWCSLALAQDILEVEKLWKIVEDLGQALGLQSKRFCHHKLESLVEIRTRSASQNPPTKESTFCQFTLQPLNTTEGLSPTVTTVDWSGRKFMACSANLLANKCGSYSVQLEEISS